MLHAVIGPHTSAMAGTFQFQRVRATAIIAIEVTTMTPETASP